MLQSGTERVLLDELDRCGMAVKCETLLTGFSRDNAKVLAKIKHAPENGDESSETFDACWLAWMRLRAQYGALWAGSSF